VPLTTERTAEADLLGLYRRRGLARKVGLVARELLLAADTGFLAKHGLKAEAARDVFAAAMLARLEMLAVQR
jgi:lipopolysaccharide biosynthesis regulator YciM